MIRQPSLKKSIDQGGFTIIELLIATVVVSVILLLTTVLLINIGNLYYKGVNKSKVQNNTRLIADDVAERIKDSTVAPVNNSAKYGAMSAQVTVMATCIGNIRYSYALNMQIGTQIPHVLWRDDLNTDGNCTPVDITDTVTSKPSIAGQAVDGIELMDPNSYLSQFSVDNTASPYQIIVGVNYGTPNQVTNNICNPGSDNQFCATSTATTYATPRL
jgi:prepilin-type N-terminal cleavage/methylation domain-containing protein